MGLTPYANLSGRSGVTGYEIRRGAIVAEFQGGECYIYTASSAGDAAVATMQRLASAGRGLSTYLARHRPGYERGPP